MRNLIRGSVLTALSLAALGAGAVEMNGKLPLYPNGHNMNNMPANVVAAGAPMVLETDDSVDTVDQWYTANAPKTCARTAASGSVKYACEGGSIMIYKKAKTQIAFVTAFHF